MSIELIVVGGFLGAGKTTTILSIAKGLMNKGKKVGIVTNDQGSDLVDTNFLSSSGLSVLEVTGGCFCCNFDEFVNKIETIAEDEMPDVILAEPVGSCTDLIATIFKPIQLKNFKNLSLRPLTVVVDPKRMKKLMIEKSNYHSEINYLFRKQLEEADIIALNKIDNFAQDEINELITFIKNQFNGTEIIPISAKENTNIHSLIERLSEIGTSYGKTLCIDYDKYSTAEAYLGWLNCSAKISSEKVIDLNDFIMKYMNDVKKALLINNYEIAHFKVYGVNSEDWCKASITSISDPFEFSKKSEKLSNEWSLIINIRADISPESLKKIIESIFYQNAAEQKLEISYYNIDAFKPGRPSPTHRYK